jgi:hypothetical protein
MDHEAKVLALDDRQLRLPRLALCVHRSDSSTTGRSSRSPRRSPRAAKTSLDSVPGPWYLHTMRWRLGILALAAFAVFGAASCESGAGSASAGVALSGTSWTNGQLSLTLNADLSFSLFCDSSIPYVLDADGTIANGITIDPRQTLTGSWAQHGSSLSMSFTAYPSLPKSFIVIGDVDQSGNKEIIVTSANGTYLVLVHS